MLLTLCFWLLLFFYPLDVDSNIKQKWYLYVIGAMSVGIAYHEWKLHKGNATPVAFDPAAYGATSSDVPTASNPYGGGIFSDPSTGTDASRTIANTSAFVPGIALGGVRGPDNNYTTIGPHGAVLNKTLVG